MMTAADFLHEATVCLQEGKTEQANARTKIAEVLAYQDRTRMLGEANGWCVDGRTDQYVQKLCDELLDGTASAIRELAEAINHRTSSDK